MFDEPHDVALHPDDVVRRRRLDQQLVRACMPEPSTIGVSTSAYSRPVAAVSAP